MEDNTKKEVILTISIVTRNRKLELLRALQSCIECQLPDQTEFVIVDNGSQDGTRDAVAHFFGLNKYDYDYCQMTENVGPAKGRNEGLCRAHGRYVYFMDDDAYIDGPKPIFFEKMVTFLKENSDVFCVTTSIFDTALNIIRGVISSKKLLKGKYPKVFMFHGGSFLVDRQRLINRDKLFLDYQFWGMEELYPSLKTFFINKFIVEMKEMSIIHQPSENSRFDLKKGMILHSIGSVHIKLIFFPVITYPILYMMFMLRIIRHLGLGTLPEALKKLSQINKDIKKETVPLITFLKFANEFGFKSIL